MKDEAILEIKNLSLSEMSSLLNKIVSTKKEVQGSIVEVNEEDLKPKRVKRGKKN